MKMFKATWIIIFLHAIIMSAHSMTLEDLVDSIVTLPSPDDLAVSQLLHAVGGRDEFQEEVKNSVAEASLWRNGTQTAVVYFKVGSKAVAKICFIDGICWAAKIVK